MISAEEPPEPSAPLVAVEMDVTQPLTLAEALRKNGTRRVARGVALTGQRKKKNVGFWDY
jgi:hypothetical protein